MGSCLSAGVQVVGGAQEKSSAGAEEKMTDEPEGARIASGRHQPPSSSRQPALLQQQQRQQQQQQQQQIQAAGHAHATSAALFDASAPPASIPPGANLGMDVYAGNMEQQQDGMAERVRSLMAQNARSMTHMPLDPGPHCPFPPHHTLFQVHLCVVLPVAYVAQCFEEACVLRACTCNMWAVVSFAFLVFVCACYVCFLCCQCLSPLNVLLCVGMPAGQMGQMGQMSVLQRMDQMALNQQMQHHQHQQQLQSVMHGQAQAAGAHGLAQAAGVHALGAPLASMAAHQRAIAMRRGQIQGAGNEQPHTTPGGLIKHDDLMAGSPTLTNGLSANAKKGQGRHTAREVPSPSPAAAEAKAADKHAASPRTHASSLAHLQAGRHASPLAHLQGRASRKDEGMAPAVANLFAMFAPAQNGKQAGPGFCSGREGVPVSRVSSRPEESGFSLALPAAGPKGAPPSTPAAREAQRYHRQQETHHREQGARPANRLHVLQEDAAVGGGQEVCALLCGYVGSRYHGLQKHDNGPPTVEEELESALIKTGALVYDASVTVRTRSNGLKNGDLAKAKWSHASRTDKGVHAVGQVIALQVYLSPFGPDWHIQEANLVQKLNACLELQVCSHH